MNQSRIALVIIGRNEARNLEISLPGIAGHFAKTVFVDSGSTDDSLAIVKTHGADVVELDTSIPFTAARARNAGLQKVLTEAPEIELIQFIDGDCELIPEYIDAAVAWLDNHPEYGMVCGRRVERYPENSMFNQLCDLEWDTPVGDTRYCGGDVMVRSSAIAAIEGYNETLIAGEDPELCVRLRQAGWKLRRIAADMTHHDANITKLSQWWKRHERAGYAFAEGSTLHGAPPENHWVKETRSNWIYGGLVSFSLLASLLIHPAWLLMLLVYPAQIARLTLRSPAHISSKSLKLRLFYAVDCLAAKIPQCVGQCRYFFNRLSKRQQGLIEYK